MAPKKAAPAGAKPSKPKSSGSAAHGSYQEMIKEAIISLKERNGSSRQAIKKYIQANNNLGSTTEAAFNTHLSRALSSGEEAGVFARPKGPSGPVKLAKKDAAKPKKESSAPAKTAAKKEKTTTKKATTKAAPKKAATATKKTATTKTATKKTATKANAGKPRKTASSAPAVEDKPPVVLGKTKSGRVTKTKAPAATTKKPAAKKAATKKTTTKKAAAPKKAATPKKTEAAAA